MGDQLRVKAGHVVSKRARVSPENARSRESHTPLTQTIKGSLSSGWVRVGIWLHLFPSLERGTGRKPCCEICQESEEPDLSQRISLSSLSGQRWCSGIPHPSLDLPSLAQTPNWAHWSVLRAVPKAVGHRLSSVLPEDPGFCDAST